MNIVLKEREFGGNFAKMVLDDTNCEIQFICNGKIIDEYGRGVWDNIKDDVWIIDIFFDFAVERYINSRPSKEYVDALISININN